MCPKLNQISFLDISHADFISDAHRTRLPVCRPSVPSNMDSLLTVSWAKLQTSPLSPSREQSVHTQSHSWNRPFKCYSMLSRDTAELCPPLVPWVGHTEVGRCFGRSCWHQMTRLTKLAPLRQWWRKWRRQDGVRVRIQKWRATQLTGSMSARHRTARRLIFLSLTFIQYNKSGLYLYLQCLGWPEVNISMDIITFW